MLTKRLPIDYRYTKGLSSIVRLVIKAATAKFDHRIATVEEFVALLQRSDSTCVV